jgi:hypothetical protein
MRNSMGNAICNSMTGALLGFSLLFCIAAHAGSPLLGIKVSVTNPSAQERHAEPVVIPISELRKVAPGLRAGALIVTVTHSKSVDEDAAAIQATEVPSQVDDLDNDGKADELAFQLDLKPFETCIVTISYSAPGEIFKIRGDYPAQTDALFAKKIQGLGWESQKNAWRIYFDPRNAIDLYGKQRSTLLLKRFATPEFDYHAESPDGRDIYEIGNALGIGSVGAWRDGKLIKVSDVRARSYQVISTGPVRAIAELTYEGWNAGGRPVALRTRITQWAGDRGFYQTITADAGQDFTFATGLPLKPKVPVFHSATGRTWLASWGEQVLKPGATATEPIPGTNLGLGVVMVTPAAAVSVDDPSNHLLTFSTQAGSASWYTLSAWDQEGSNDRVAVANNSEMQERASLVTPHPGIQNKDQFVQTMQQIADAIGNPAQTKVLSSGPAAQSAPPDTLAPATPKTYSQAIGLLKQEIDRTATKWEPIITASAPDSMGPNKGLGFFTEGDNQTGEWKKHEGYFWTGSFWVGELWKMYSHTHEEKYRRWAELWNSRLLGAELQQNHDAGFLYYYSSVLGNQQTGSPELKESGLRAAERVSQLFNPQTQLVASWVVNGDDTIVDTMMNLQILWWASEQTGDPKWRDIGLKHASKTAEWFLRPDGSVTQSVHYNPGDGRQRLDLRGGTVRNANFDFPNNSKPGEMLFSHTHQGLAAGTTWSRGAAWALYGFSQAYAATRDPGMLSDAVKVADYILSELPEDGVPWFDFDDAGVHYRNRDSSAAALIAGGLLKLSRHVGDKDKAARYHAESKRITQSLIDHYLSPVGSADSSPPGILRHGCATRPNDGMLIYGQYFLLETLVAIDEDANGSSSTAGAAPQAPAPAVELPRVFLLNPKVLVAQKQRLATADKNDTLTAAVRSAADRAMKEGPFSVMDKDRVPPSGDKHDYMSQAPYFWPDPKSANGLPYVRRDGERNPEILKITDHDNMGRVGKASRILALAFYLTGNEAYAARAALLMRKWFLDPATRMNPNLNFGQGIPGVSTGRKTGIIDSRGLTDVVDAVGLLASSDNWMPGDQKGMEKWFADYLSWLQQSENGRGEAEEKNNHGTFYDVQVADFALFAGKQSLAHDVLKEAEKKRIARQVMPDGSQPLETERTRGFSYSVFNLEGLMELAKLGEVSRVDLWNFQSSDGGSIRRALDFLLPFAGGDKKWGHQQITEFKPQELTPLLLEAAIKFGNPDYEKTARKIGISENDVNTLLILSESHR